MRNVTFQKEEGFVIVNGARVHYERAGVGYPLVLLHGLVGSARNWRSNIDFLAQYATVFALDLCNMGESDRIAGLDTSLEATANRVAVAMEALGLKEADIAGHSHGGAVAMMLAARHPARVRNLVLFAPANPYCDLGQHLIRFYQTRFGIWFAKQIPFLPRMLKAVALGRMYGDPKRVTDQALDGYIKGLHVPGTVDHILGIVRGWSTDMSHLRGVMAQLAEKPTLMIWGDRDRAVGLASARQLARALKRSSLLVLPGVGHIAFEEMPDICNRAMSEWLAGSSHQPRSAA